jgi:hypothetical protein
MVIIPMQYLTRDACCKLLDEVTVVLQALTQVYCLFWLVSRPFFPFQPAYKKNTIQV